MPRKTPAELRPWSTKVRADEGRDNAIASLGLELHAAWKAWKSRSGAPTSRTPATA